MEIHTPLYVADCFGYHIQSYSSLLYYFDPFSQYFGHKQNENKTLGLHHKISNTRTEKTIQIYIYNPKRSIYIYI